MNSQAKPASPSLPSISPRDWIVPAAMIAAVYAALFLFMPYSEGYLGGRMPVFRTAWIFWNTEKNWGHGMFVPPIVIAMIWFRRRQLAEIPCKGSNWGIVIVAFTLALYWLGFVVDHHYIGFVSAQLLAAGLIIWFLGWKMMQALIVEWAFLVFTWPFLFLDSVIAFPLRMALSDFAYHFLNTIGIASVKIGSSVASAPNPQLNIPTAKLFAIDIADPCSGMHSLFALLMVGACYVHFFVRGFWKKWAVFLAAIPIAVFGNFCRILTLVFGTLMFGSDFAIGSEAHPTLFHQMSGFFVFGVGLMALTGLTKLLDVDWKELRRKFQKTREQTVRGENTSGKTVESAADLY